jgi:tetratricopeptide (TPR) repeat protein
MSKSYIAVSAAVFALALSVKPMSLSAAEPSKAALKTIAAANEAYKAKRCPEAMGKTREVLAMSDKSSYDTYLSHSINAACNQQMGNKAELLKSLQGQLDSGYPQSAEQNQIIKNMYGTAFELKDYAQAVELGQRLIRTGSATSDTYDQVAAAMVQQGKKAEAAKFLGDYVADLEKRGQKPSEATLTRLRALYDELGNREAASQIVEKLVVFYPKADYWNLLTHQLSRDPKLTERQKLQIFRLKVATGTLKRCQDYSDMEELADAAGMPGESQKVIEQALAAKICTVKSDEERLRRHLNAIANVVAKDKEGFAKLEAAAKVAKTGEQDLAVGSQLFGYGEYAKSAEALARAVAKGGLKYPADAQLTLGVAQMRSGNKAEAMKTFRSIKGDPASQRIAELWILNAR